MDRWIQVGKLDVLASPESFGRDALPVLVRFPDESIVRQLTLSQAANACAPLGLRVKDIRFGQQTGPGWVGSNYTAGVLNDYYSK